MKDKRLKERKDFKINVKEKRLDIYLEKEIDLEKKSKKDNKSKGLEEKVERNVKIKKNKKIELKIHSKNSSYRGGRFQQQFKMLDYSKLFSYMNKKDPEKYPEIDSPYLLYSETSETDVDVVHNKTEIITKEAIDQIIEDKIIEDILGFSSCRSDYADRELFNIYKLFNKSLVELKYSIGI